MIIKNARVLGDDFRFFTGDVRVENGRIAGIGSFPGEGETVDAAGLCLLPGLIDIHTHGSVGCDASDAKESSLEKMAAFQASNGVTSFLPASMTLGEAELERVFRCIGEYMASPHAGACLRGVYMEGPFFSGEKKGAQKGEYLRNPDISLLRRLNDCAGGRIRVVAVAPELPGALEFIREAKSIARVSVAHTVADYDQTMRAFDAGASHMTHLYNAMPGFRHRDPGPVGAAFDREVTVELICDGIHIHPAVIRATYREVGAQRVVLVSDSMQASGMPDGEYTLGGQTVYVSHGKATLADGTIAGSTTNLGACVRNAVKFGVPLPDAVRSATINPARVAGIDRETGSIACGKYADLLLTDPALGLKAVFIRGVRQPRRD